MGLALEIVINNADKGRVVLHVLFLVFFCVPTCTTTCTCTS